MITRAIRMAVRGGASALSAATVSGDGMCITLPGRTISLYDLIFDRTIGFARGLWGTDTYHETRGDYQRTWRNWEYHLSQIALEEQPLSYLALFVE